MNGRSAGPLSPVSIGGSEWSGISKYQTLETDSPYSPNNRGQLASPPISSGSNGTMNGGGFPRGPGENGPSPPASIARSSNGASQYNGTTVYGASDNGRKEQQFEATLSEHYVALKRYLAASLRDEKGNPRPNKARDKLLRLSYVQFQELSTDVFDELLRRQAAGRKTPNGGPPEGVPAFLLPKDTFHPKRNQARQKLSTLPPPRFRDLATDVFYELERRFPRFAGGDISRTDSPASMRGPPSRSGNGTPVDPMRPGSRGGPRMRRPSEASSISQYPRSDSRSGSRMGGPMSNGLGVPGSPGIPPNDYGRPLAKTFQSNTIVPNKSTMVEDDDDAVDTNDDDDGDAFGLENAARGTNAKGAVGSEADKKIIEDYKTQVGELREKLQDLEGKLQQKNDELDKVMDGERNRATTTNMEKKEWSDLRLKLEDQLSDAQNLAESLQSEVERVRADQSGVERDLRAQIEELKASGGGSRGMNGSNEELELENDELRAELREQQEITEDVRREAQEFLREMRVLSERSGSSYEREDQLVAQVERLEEEVKDWRNRYARTKTQLRSLRASSIGLTIQQDAAKYAKDSGFTQDDGLVKDVHVTKYQISIDELLRTARTEDPARVVDYMKSVVVSVRNITQDIDESSKGVELSQAQAKLKSRVSATANNLITASKNFASAKGVSPVSLLDAAASHLTAAVVELVRTVKIRPTPAGELDDDDDGVLPAEDPTGFFSQRDSTQDRKPPPFLGLGNRGSGVSSMYSPVNSPRQSGAPRPRSSSSKDGWPSRRPISRGGPMTNGINGMMNGNNKNLPPAPVGFGIRTQDSDVEDLKIYLEDQTALLVQTIQSLVSSIRSEAGITAINNELTAIATVVGKVISSTETAMASTGNVELRAQGDPIIKKLALCRQRLLEAGDKGRQLADTDDDDGKGEMEWRMWTQSLPPIAFEIARETKELVLRVDIIDGGGEDFT